MLKPFSIVSCLLIVFSLITTVSASALDDKKEKPPIVITSQSLTADNKENIAIFEGSVVAKTEDLTIYSDKMTVFYNNEEGKKEPKNCWYSNKNTPPAPLYVIKQQWSTECMTTFICGNKF